MWIWRTWTLAGGPGRVLNSASFQVPRDNVPALSLDLLISKTGRITVPLRVDMRITELIHLKALSIELDTYEVFNKC